MKKVFMLVVVSLCVAGSTAYADTDPSASAKAKAQEFYQQHLQQQQETAAQVHAQMEAQAAQDDKNMAEKQAADAKELTQVQQQIDQHAQAQSSPSSFFSSSNGQGSNLIPGMPANLSIPGVSPSITEEGTSFLKDPFGWIVTTLHLPPLPKSLHDLFPFLK